VEAIMAMMIEDAASMSLTAQDPATLGELLTAGKKVPPQAATLLMQDHADVKAMFRQYEGENGNKMKALLAGKICTALTVHALIEEEIFYPQAGQALKDDEIIAEAVDEHGEMKEQIAKIVEATAAGKSIGRPMKKLMRIVEHHVEEEETGMLPDMRRTDVDLYEIGGLLAARRVEALLGLKRERNDMEAWI
jgi:hemerythrin superfamily protein